MAAPLATLPPPKPAPRKRKPRITYRVTIEPGGDPVKGEELLLRWLAEVLSG